MDYVNLPLGLRVQSQIPLDVKQYSSSENDLKDLGDANNLAYIYQQGLVVYCIAEQTRWEWKEDDGTSTGLLSTNFTYPNGISAFGVNYSGREFNFFEYGNIPPAPPLQDFQSVTDVGFITDNEFYRYKDYGEGRAVLGVVNDATGHNPVVGVRSATGIVGEDDFSFVLGFNGDNGYGEKPNILYNSLNRHLLFDFPLLNKPNPNYPNPNNYTLATVDDLSLQRIVSVFPSNTYIVTNADNNFVLFIDNGATNVTIQVDGSINIPNFSCGFIQKGTGTVTFFTPNVFLKSPMGLVIKGTDYNAFLERELTTSNFYLLGNLKN